jgi:hypothetical protein
MVRGVIGALGLATVLVLAGCNEPQEQSGNIPDFKVAVPPTACNPNEFNTLIAGYFPSSLQNSVKALKDAMLNTPSSDTTRRAIGYEIMDSIGRWSRNGSTTLSASALAAGSSLTKAVIKCIYDASVTSEFPSFPDSVLYSFDRALNAPAGGAYFVRPQADLTTSSAVVGKTTSAGNLSGIAPPGVSSWGDILDEKTLIYGWPEPNDVFEWALIRPNAIFDPAAVVAICSGAVPVNTLVEESNIGFLTWAGNGSTICTATQTTTMLESGWGLGGLASRLARWGTGLVTPQPLHAAVVTSGGTGTAKTLKSKLSLGGVDGITLALVSGPKPVEHKNVAFDVQVFAFTLEGTDSVGVNNVCTRVTAFNNNGQPVVLQGPKDCGGPTNNNQLTALTETTDIGGKPKAGYVTISVTVPTTGALKLAIDAVPLADDNLDTTPTSTSTGKFNVKP